MAGLAIAIREKPDLIMLDFDMPVFNGLQVLKGLSIEVGLKNIPVIVMTGRPDILRGSHRPTVFGQYGSRARPPSALP
jgi:CheY-like chemotaxis protein